MDVAYSASRQTTTSACCETVPTPPTSRRAWVASAGTSYVVTAELPGVNKDEIDVELNEGRLSISVDKRETEEHKAKNFLHKETHEWSSSRGVYLKDAATAGLTAKLDGGVLTITVPKQEEKVNVTKVSID